jgi:hypothetical protein
VTNPSFAKVTNGSNHFHPGCKFTGMFDDTVSSLEHALDLATLGTLGKSGMKKKI